jgi:hypothetical protein
MLTIDLTGILIDSLTTLWTAKELALQRIKYQLLHFKRLEPLIRQKQIQAKDVSHMININKTTLWLNKITQVVKELQLVEYLLKE